MRKMENNASGIHEAMAHYLESLITSRDFASAISCYEDNRSELDCAGGPGAALVMRLAATAYASLADYPVALRTARTAQTLQAEFGDSRELAETFVVIGGILRNLGELREAEKAFRDAESIFRRNDCPEGQSRALNLLAGLFFKQSDFSQALTVLMDAVDIARRLNDRHKLAFMMGNIGRIHTFVGDFEKACSHLQINIELSEELGQTQELPRAYMSLGYVHILTDRFDDAEIALNNAREQLVQCDCRRDEVMYLTYLGELKYRSGELGAARDILEQALAITEKIDPETTLTGRVLRHLAEVAVLSSNLPMAQRYVARAMVIMDKAGVTEEVGALWRLRAQVAEIQDNESDARNHYGRSLDLLAESGICVAQAETLIAAGRTKVFTRRQRLTYLFRAEEFYRRDGITNVVDRIQRLIADTDSDLDQNKLNQAPTSNAGKAEFLTSCPEIESFKKQLSLIGRSNLPMMLTGQTGTGKDHMARYFRSVVRPDGPFVAVNCASIPETLLESELFGYHKGAFTGADKDKPGLLTSANGGVLYLDEIGDLPLSLQSKLLGVLETRRVIPIGSTTEIKLDILLVSATNQNLELMVEKGSFRRDLFYRISGISFHIPSLKRRKEDIPLLLNHFLSQCSLTDDGKIPTELVHLFVKYDWPGNVRELVNKIKRLEVMAAMVTEGDLIELSRSIFSADQPRGEKSLFERVEQFERRLINEALLASGGNKSRAARILGIHEATVRTKLKRYGISCEGGVVN
ncbi:MAG: sigma 54-interacting transcriptional regulator [candidate division Zixibacteria bacterium]|nr:sigma 54-interacting transcriptional regulator [candidate division Zixibacteria bacterium]